MLEFGGRGKNKPKYVSNYPTDFDLLKGKNLPDIFSLNALNLWHGCGQRVRNILQTYDCNHLTFLNLSGKEFVNLIPFKIVVNYTYHKTDHF